MGIADILGKRKPLAVDVEEMDMAPDDSSDSESKDSKVTMSDEASPEEVKAMRLFERASTPEQKVRALKSFLEACGVY